MQTEELLDLYVKERDYQTSVFGDYSKSPALNFGTFILFMDEKKLMLINGIKNFLNG